MADFSLKACIEAVKEDLKWRKCSTQELREHYLECQAEQGPFWNKTMFEALEIVENELKGENIMKTTTFEINGTTYFTSGNGYYYAETNGIKFRISKAKFEQAHTEFIEEASRLTEESVATEEVLEVVRENLSQEKPKKANKKRIPKNVGHRKTYGEVEVILTEKQVDFIRHLPDTCYWENGLDSAIWVDCLCDEIGGQFAGKPMTVGAMISTICEKGLGKRGKDRINGRKCTSFALTALGRWVARDLGL